MANIVVLSFSGIESRLSISCFACEDEGDSVSLNVKSIVKVCPQVGSLHAQYSVANSGLCSSLLVILDILLHSLHFTRIGSSSTVVLKFITGFLKW